MTQHPAGHREDGFTLVELLIALVLLGFVSTLGFGGLRLGMGALAKVPPTSSEVPVLQRMMRTWLSQAAPVLLGDGGAESVVGFLGEPDRIVWTSPLPERFAAPGLNRISLALDRDGGRSDLVMTWQPHRPELVVDAPPTGTQRPILSDVAGLRFRYFGVPHDGAVPEWSDRWEGLRTLPQMVEMSLELPATDRRAWPVLTVALRIDDTMSRGGRR